MSLCCLCGEEISPNLQEFVYGGKKPGSIICSHCFKKVGESWMEIHQASKPKEKPSTIERLKAIASGETLKNCSHQISLVEQMNEDSRFVQDQLKDLLWVVEDVKRLLDSAIYDENLPGHALVNRCQVRILMTKLNKLFHKGEAQ